MTFHIGEIVRIKEENNYSRYYKSGDDVKIVGESSFQRPDYLDRYYQIKDLTDDSKPFEIFYEDQLEVSPNKEDTFQFKTVEVDRKKYKASIDPNNPNNLLLEEIIPRTFKFGDTVKNIKSNEYGIFSIYYKDECRVYSKKGGVFVCKPSDIELVTETNIPD